MLAVINREKKQQTDPRAEGKKETQHKLRTYKYTKCIYFRFETQTFLE